jgi:hypothetical protein
MNRKYRRFLVSIVCVFLANCSTGRCQSWAQKLGFAPEAKVVILGAREMGVSWEMNESGKQLLEAGHLSSASVAVTAPWFEEFAAWRRSRPDDDIGISIVLTNPYPVIHWRLLTTGLGSTTLVDGDGLPWSNIVQLAANAAAEDVRHELESQINRARTAGLQPSHLNAFQGAIFCRTDLTALLLAASQKYWIPTPVVDLTPELIERFRRQGFPVDDELVRLINDYPLPKLDDVHFVPAAETYEQKRDLVLEILRTLRPGLTQLTCQPAVESRGLQLLTADWQQRVWDAQVMSDEQVQQTMEQEKIIVTNWRDIMRRFQLPAGPDGDNGS